MYFLITTLPFPEVSTQMNDTSHPIQGSAIKEGPRRRMMSHPVRTTEEGFTQSVCFEMSLEKMGKISIHVVKGQRQLKKT